MHMWQSANFYLISLLHSLFLLSPSLPVPLFISLPLFYLPSFFLPLPFPFHNRELLSSEPSTAEVDLAAFQAVLTTAAEKNCFP